MFLEKQAAYPILVKILLGLSLTCKLAKPLGSINAVKKVKFVLVGGFLGAGKTTLIGEVARRYTAMGKRVGIITNDQAADLVDTQNLRSQGFEVGEVSGACFCCSFNDLVDAADVLVGDNSPDVLLAEPVGSCTDLVATVILPLAEQLGDRFELAPFGVLLKPSHALRLLKQDATATRSGFSPQAEYIFHKQLEEADFLLISRADLLSVDEVDSLEKLLAESAPGVPVIPVSGRTGLGVDSVLECIDNPAIAGRRLLDIDYDVYAQGEAELGWVNLSAHLRGRDSEISLDEVANHLVAGLSTRIIAEQGEIAHVKVSILGGDTQAVANVVSNEGLVEVGLMANRFTADDLHLIVNARVAMDPQQLELICRESVDEISKQFGGEVHQVTSHSLRPGRPVPTHRVQA